MAGRSCFALRLGLTACLLAVAPVWAQQLSVIASPTADGYISLNPTVFISFPSGANTSTFLFTVNGVNERSLLTVGTTSAFGTISVNAGPVSFNVSIAGSQGIQTASATYNATDAGPNLMATATTAGPNVTLTVICSDNTGCNASEASVAVDGRLVTGQCSLNSSGGTCSLSGLAPGSHVGVVSYANNIGNFTNKTISFTVASPSLNFTPNVLTGGIPVAISVVYANCPALGATDVVTLITPTGVVTGNVIVNSTGVGSVILTLPALASPYSVMAASGSCLGATTAAIVQPGVNGFGGVSTMTTAAQGPDEPLCQALQRECLDGILALPSNAGVVNRQGRVTMWNDDLLFFSAQFAKRRFRDPLLANDPECPDQLRLPVDDPYPVDSAAPGHGFALGQPGFSILPATGFVLAGPASSQSNPDLVQVDTRLSAGPTLAESLHRATTAGYLAPPSGEPIQIDEARIFARGLYCEPAIPVALPYTHIFYAPPRANPPACSSSSDETYFNLFVEDPFLVDASNGSFKLEPGLAFSGRKLPIAFEAFFNGQDPYTGPVGVGWTHTYNVQVIPSGVNAVLKEGDGREILFNGAGDGVFTSAIPGVLDTLSQNPDSTYTLTRRNHVRLDFSASGQLTFIADPNGNNQTLTYTAGNLTSVTDNSGRALQLTYDGNNRILTVTDPLGRTLHYSYDASGRQVSYTAPDGSISRYAYDDFNNLKQITDSRGNAEVQTDYDVQRRVISRTDAAGSVTAYAYNTPSTGITTETDPLGRVTLHAYDAQGRISSITNALGGVNSVTYNANNMILTGTDPLGRVTQFAYDANSNLTQATDPAGNVYNYAYDGNNNLLSATDPLLHTRTYTYDARNNLTQLQDALGDITAWTYNSFGQVTQRQNPTGATTQYGYNAAGDLISRTDGLGNVTQYAYDAVGRRTGVTDPLGNQYTFTYDPLDRLTQLAGPLSQTTSYAYDANGNLTSLTDPRGIVTQSVYDVLNRPASTTEAVGTAEQRTTSYGYDADSDLTSVTDARGNVTTYTYDALSRRTGQTDPLGNTAGTTYDADGNVTSTTDANGNTNRFTYDTVNRLIGETPFSGNPVSHSYDAVGNETSMTDGRGANTYTYDASYRLTSAHTPDGNTIDYAYDPANRLTAITLPNATQQRYIYDAVDRVVTAQDGAGQTTAYTYDADSRLLKEAFPNGDSTNYVYDAVGRVTSAVNMSGTTLLSSNVYQYDADNNRVQDTTAAGSASHYAYDHVNRVTSLSPSSGQATSYSYDANGNRTAVNAPSGITNYSYDAANRMTGAGATVLSYDHNGNLTNDGVHMYIYDAYNRLAGITGYGVSYSYDGHGLRVGETTPSGSYQYVNNSANGRVLLENGPDGNFVNFYAGAHLISETSPALQLYYHYDSIGNVVAATDNTGRVKQNYSYNAWGQNATIDTLGTKNKYKAMRGYTDPVTGFVYLGGGSYYNPVWGRTFSGQSVSGYPDAYVFDDDNPVQ